VTLGFIAAEIVVGILTAIPEPTLLTKVVAFILQGLIMAMIGFTVGTELTGAIIEGGRWFSLCHQARGNPDLIAEASRSFLRMVRHILLAILTIIGARAKLREPRLPNTGAVGSSSRAVGTTGSGSVGTAAESTGGARVYEFPAARPAATATPVRPVSPIRPTAPARPVSPIRPAARLASGGEAIEGATVRPLQPQPEPIITEPAPQPIAPVIPIRPSVPEPIIPAPSTSPTPIATAPTPTTLPNVGSTVATGTAAGVATSTQQQRRRREQTSCERQYPNAIPIR
jgi:hypothetical protein